MASDSRRFVVVSLLVAGCATGDPRRFPLAAPVLRDRDLEAVVLPCDGTPKCAPKPRTNYLIWDSVDNSAFRPATDFLRARRGGEAIDVNAYDEVPSSSFFENRLGARALTPAEVETGFCAAGPLPDANATDGAWLVDHGKDNGANPGFRIKTAGTKFMLKTDAGEGERATAATAIATRLYYAAGFWAPCDAIVYFRRSLLRVAPGLTVQANAGSKKPFDEAAVDRQLEKAERRGPLIRAVASRWLPGTPLGPFAYEGTKDDDPGDLVPHEKRRPLRGSRLMAAWLNHFDAREQNTMATWEPDDAARPGRGHVRHWMLDMGDCFGSQWDNDLLSRKHGHSYFLDTRHMAEDFVTLGIPQRPWDTARIAPGLEDFGYFSADRFDPEAWRGEYPMLPFANMTEQDGAWMTRIIARFTPAHIEAAVRAGNLTNPAHSQFLVRTLLARQRAILQRYFSKLSPLTDLSSEGDELCAVDLARSTSTYPAERFRYHATVQRGGAQEETTPVRVLEDGRVCVSAPARVRDASAADARGRYVVLRITNGASTGALEVHLYDLGNRMQLSGVVR